MGDKCGTGNDNQNTSADCISVPEYGFPTMGTWWTMYIYIVTLVTLECIAK